MDSEPTPATSHTAAPAPALRPRLEGFDLARCIAILAMVFVNFEVVLKMAGDDADAPAWLTVLAEMCEGNASALFVMLAGMGTVLLGRRRVILIRAGLLLVLGYLWQTVWSGDILHYYAFYLAAGAVALRCGVRTLWLLALASVGGWLLLSAVLDYGAGWDWGAQEYREFWSLRGQVRNLVFNGWHPLLPWLGFYFAGMALARWRFFERRRRRVVLLLAVGVYCAVWATSNYLTQLPDERPLLDQMQHWYLAPQYLWGMGSIPPGPCYMLSAAAAAVAVTCLAFEIAEVSALKKVLAPLLHCGQLALTFYLAHVLMLLIVVLLLAEQLDVPMLTLAFGCAVAFGVCAIVFATLWRRKFRRGPLEALMRMVSG